MSVPFDIVPVGKVGDVLDDDWLNPLIYHRDPHKILSKARIPAQVAKI